MSYVTYYRVFDKKGKIEIDHWDKSWVCFRTYAFNDNKDFGTRTIEIKVLKNYDKEYSGHAIAKQLYSKEEIFAYIELLNTFGFIFKVEEEKNYYVVTAKESDYMCKSHIRVALDYIRVLWENGINNIYKAYQKLPANIVNKYDDKFVLFQVLTVCLAATSKCNEGHRLPCIQGMYSYMDSKQMKEYGIVITKDQMEKFYKKHKNHEDGSFVTWSQSLNKKSKINLIDEMFNDIYKELK